MDVYCIIVDGNYEFLNGNCIIVDGIDGVLTPASNEIIIVYIIFDII